jgi:hypothetical protein
MLPQLFRKHAATLLTGLALLAALPAAQAERVLLHLRNGDRVSGDITAESPSQVTLKTDWGTPLTIPNLQILRREILPPPSAGIPAAPTNPPPVLVVAKTNAPPKEPLHWHGEMQVGADLTFSERDRQLYYGRFKVTYANDLNIGGSQLHHFRNVFDYNATYALAEGLLSDNKMEGTSKTDFDLNQRIFVYNLIGAGYDEIRKIDFRYEVGPGLGYHLIKQTNLTLNAEIGANYQARYFADAEPDDTRFFLRLAEDFTLKLSKKFTFDEKFEYFPRAEDMGQFRWRFESNLRYLFWDNLFFNLTVIDIYDTQPARNIPHNDLQVRSSVGVKF